MRKSVQPCTFNATPERRADSVGTYASERIDVPAQIMVCIPTAAMCRDPDYFSDPDTFNPSRFYQSRSAAVNSTKEPADVERNRVQVGKGGKEKGDHGDAASEASFAGLDPRMPIWGLGRWSCPGRHYADLQIKLTIAEILLNWDVSLPEPLGDTRGADASPNASPGAAHVSRRSIRLERISTGDRMIPNPSQNVIFTRRIQDWDL